MIYDNIRSKVVWAVVLGLILGIMLTGGTEAGGTSNLSAIWHIPEMGNSINITPVGDIFNNGFMNFISVNVSGSSTTISLLNGNNGNVEWSNETINTLIEYVVLTGYSHPFEMLGLWSNGLDYQLDMYNISSGSVIWGSTFGNAQVQNASFLIEPSMSGLSLYSFVETPLSSPVLGLENYSITVSDLSLFNGSVLWHVEYPYLGNTVAVPYTTAFAIPSSPGLRGGGVLISPSYIIGNNVISYIDLISAENGKVLWNISSPIYGYLTTASVGNYIAGNFYNIAYTTTGTKSDGFGGSIAILNITTGSVIYTSSTAHVLPLIDQMISAYNQEVATHQLPQQFAGVTLNSPTGTEYILAEYIGAIITSQGVTPNSLVAIDAGSNTTVWRAYLPGVIFETLFNYYILPSNMTSGNSEVIATSSRVNTVYGIVNGNLAWKKKLTEPVSYLYGLSDNPEIYSYNNMFVLLNITPVSGGMYNISFYNGVTGNYISNSTLSFSISFSSVLILPMSYITSTGIPSFAFVGIYRTASSYTDAVDILSPAGTLESAFTLNGTFMFINGTTFYSIFYPGLSNGQLTSDGTTNDFIVGSSYGVYAYDMSSASIQPLKLNLFTASAYSGVVPLNDSFYVNVTGGEVPYSYEWDINGTYYSTNVPDYSYTFYNVGIYRISVVVRDSIGNYVNSSVLTVNVTQTQSNNSSRVIYYSVNGVVESSSGVLEGVAVYSSSGNSTTTGANGAFTMNLANGTWELRFVKSGYTTAYYNVTVTGHNINNVVIIMNSTASTVPPSSAVNNNNGQYGEVVVVIVVVVVLVILAYLLLVRKRSAK